jgi:multiple sugar transport system permease protein
MKPKSAVVSFEKGNLLPFLLMLPTILIILCIMAAPLCYGLYLSFFDLGFGTLNRNNSFLGLGNYIRFFSDELARRALVNTVIFSMSATAGDLFLGTLVAALLLKINRFMSVILRPLVTIPLLISAVVIGLIWRYIYDPAGILYWFLRFFGIGLREFPGVTGASTALFSTVIAHWWQVTPFVIIVVTAGLLSIPEELYEAARIDGAGAFNTFFRITLPQLKNVYMVILLISGVDTFKVFDIIYALTRGGPHNSSISLSIYAYSMAFDQSQMSYSMSISFLTMLFTFLIFGIPFVRYNTKKGKE